MPPLFSADVLFCLTGDARRNSRALRQLRALAGAGLRVAAGCLGPDPGLRRTPEGIALHVLAPPGGRGPLFFAAVHRLFAALAAQYTARVYHASDLYTLNALAGAARRRQARLVYDARELYPHVAATTGRPWVRAFWRWAEGRAIGRADQVFTVSPSIADHLAAAYGIRRPVVTLNAPPFQRPAPSDRLRARLGLPAGVPLLLHQGQMQRRRGGEALLAAMQRLDRETLIFMGGGPLRPALEQRARRLGLAARVRFLDPEPPDALLAATASADVGITLLEDTCLNHRYALPNKLFEYLMAGLPVLASDLPEMRALVEGYGAGRLVRPDAGPEVLAEALHALATDEAARAAWKAGAARAAADLNWETQQTGFLRAYHTLL